MNYKCFQKLAVLNRKSAHADNVLGIPRTGFSWHMLKFVEISKISSNPQMNPMPYEPTEKQTHGWMDWQKTDKSFCSQNPLNMTFEEKTLKINSSFLIMGFCCACDKWQACSSQHPLHSTLHIPFLPPFDDKCRRQHSEVLTLTLPLLDMNSSPVL